MSSLRVARARCASSSCSESDISAPPSATAAGSPETRVAVAVGQRGRHDSSRAGVALVSKSEAMDIPRDERPDAR